MSSKYIKQHLIIILRQTVSYYYTVTNSILLLYCDKQYPIIILCKAILSNKIIMRNTLYPIFHKTHSCVSRETQTKAIPNVQNKFNHTKRKNSNYIILMFPR